MRRVYVSDLDQTLLRDDTTLSPFTRDAISLLFEKGILFTVASARSVVSMRMLLGGVRLHLPVIEFNGGFLSDLATGRHLVTNALAPETARAVHDHILAAECAPFISTFDGTADRLFHPRPQNEGMAWYLDDRLRARDSRLLPLDDLDHTLSGQVMAFTVIGRREELEPLAATLATLHNGALQLYLFENLYSPGWHWITVSDARATKGRALAELLAFGGLDGAHVVAFGDNANDLPLFEVASWSCAVANASDEVRDAADETIGANNDDGVMRWILRAEGLG